MLCLHIAQRTKAERGVQMGAERTLRVSRWPELGDTFFTLNKHFK